MKLNVYIHAVESVTFPNQVTIFQNRPQSVQFLLQERRRKHKNHDT